MQMVKEWSGPAGKIALLRTRALLPADLSSNELARAIAANRKARNIAKVKATRLCRSLSSGDSFTIDTPTREPARTDTYRTISRVAFGILGKGQYRITLNRNATVTVRRVGPRDPGQMPTCVYLLQQPMEPSA